MRRIYSDHFQRLVENTRPGLEINQRVIHSVVTGIVRNVAAEIDGLMDRESVTDVVPGRRRGWSILRTLWSVGLGNSWGRETKTVVMAMAEISRAPRRGFSSTEINENALIIPGHALLEENAAGVRAMYLYVADGARLILICLVMKRWRPGRREIHGRRVALQAEAVHVVACQQARIGRSVRDVAHGTTLGLDRRMLVNPWPDRIDMTLGADRVLRRTLLQHLRLESAMRVVAVTALD